MPSLVTGQGANAPRDELWRSIVNGVRDPVFLVDNQRHICACNQALCRLVGWSEAEIIGQPCWKILHGTNEPISVCPFDRMAKSAQREKLELVCRERYFECTLDSLVAEDGSCCGAVHVIRDIATPKAPEQQPEELMKRALPAGQSAQTPELFLTLCCQCKQVRDEGQWLSLERYLVRRYAMTFSHSVCPECAAVLYPDFCGRRALRSAVSQ